MAMHTPTVSQLQRFYKGRKILITGHTGFKGAWLAAWLVRWGAQVTGYALAPNTNPSLFNELKLHQKIHSVIGDVRDFARLKKVIQICQPDLIFHLAAQPLVLRSYQNPAETFSTNVLGTAHLLQAAALLPNPCPILNVTSDKCYANPETGRPFKETDPLGGKDPYSISKAMSEELTAYCRENLGYLPLATARAGNIIGGGDWTAGRLIPDIICKVRRRQSVILRMPTARRPWQYIVEPLFGYLLLAYQLTRQPRIYAQAWNFGPYRTNTMTVQQLAAQMLKILGQGKLQQRPAKRLREATLLRLNVTKAREQLNWQTHYTTCQTLQRTARWYRAFYDGKNAAALVEKELAAYEKLLQSL